MAAKKQTNIKTPRKFMVHTRESNQMHYQQRADDSISPASLAKFFFKCNRDSITWISWGMLLCRRGVVAKKTHISDFRSFQSETREINNQEFRHTGLYRWYPVPWVAPGSHAATNADCRIIVLYDQSKKHPQLFIWLHFKPVIYCQSYFNSQVTTNVAERE